MNHFLSKWILEGLRTRKIKRRENIMDRNTTVIKNSKLDLNDYHLQISYVSLSAENFERSVRTK